MNINPINKINNLTTRGRIEKQEPQVFKPQEDKLINNKENACS